MSFNNLVSIIMPTYNRSYVIERAIQSIMNQSYKNWELIIIDDGSTDQTSNIVQKFTDSRIVYIQNKLNRGANTARNQGVNNASGEFVTFIDSDNYWAVNKLELQVRQLAECEDDYFFLYGRIQIIDGQSIRTVPEQNDINGEMKEYELHDNLIDTNTIMLRRDLFIRVGGFDEKMPRLQDWEFALNLLWNYSCKAYFCGEILSYSELQHDSISRNQEKLWRGYRCLLEKYMLVYLNEREIINKLMSMYEMFPDKKEEIFTLIRDTSRRNPQIAVYMFEEFIKCERNLTKSKNMESLLYLWQKKNNEYHGNIFSRYFYQGSPIQNIAIYGLGHVGNLFMDAIKELPVKILCGIDKHKQKCGNLVVVSPKCIPNVDLIVITVSKDAEQIKEELEKITDNKVVTVRELLREEYK